MASVAGGHRGAGENPAATWRRGCCESEELCHLLDLALKLVLRVGSIAGGDLRRALLGANLEGSEAVEEGRQLVGAELAQVACGRELERLEALLGHEAQDPLDGLG